MTHGVSTRHGGVSDGDFRSLNMGFATPDSEADVAENRRRFASTLGVGEDDIVAARLTHGNEVAVFRDGAASHWPRKREPVRPDSQRRNWVFHTDGVVSDVPGLYFLLTAADCVPLLFLDRRQAIVGAAHAGWRGTASGIAGNVVRAMHREFGTDPEDVVAGIGPSIGPCCYGVGQDVVDTFHRHGFVPELTPVDGESRLDLWTTNRLQLMDAGLLAGSIETMGLCTSCHAADFFSHRAARGKSGRMAFAIGLG
ncbi:MAG TPA: peptidoglycan editing factor PgeF [Chloroflexota bacterium]